MKASVRHQGKVTIVDLSGKITIGTATSSCAKR